MTPHASSCALHNATASEPGPCNCGATDILERIEDKLAGVLPGAVAQLLAECAITIKANRSHIESLDAGENQLIRERDELRTAVSKYGRHLPPCAAVYGGECTCGICGDMPRS